MSEQNKNRYLDILQIFRGVAALMVVIHHAVGSLKYYHGINFTTLTAIGKFGKLGVDFFFILSGFIISYAAYYKYKDPDSFKQYIRNRIIRVYVPYLPIGILMYLLYTFLPGFSNGNREISLFTSLTLLPQGNPALSVAWTLTFELCFYALFSISFYSKRIWNYFAIVWFGSILIFNYSPLSLLSFAKLPVFRVLFSQYNIEFLIGYLLSLLIIHKVRFKLMHYSIATVTILFFVLYSLTFELKASDFYINFVFAGAMLFTLYASINYFNKRIDKKSIMMLVGNASYSIYLIHNPLQMVVLRLYPKINSIISLFLSLLLVLLLSSLFGYLYYLIFERKCMEFVKSKITKP